MNIASKQKNHIKRDDLAERIDELQKAFSDTEPAAVREDKILDSAGKLGQSVSGEATETVGSITQLASQKEKSSQKFSLKKPASALKTDLDKLGTLQKKKGSIPKVSFFHEKNQISSFNCLYSQDSCASLRTS